MKNKKSFLLVVILLFLLLFFLFFTGKNEGDNIITSSDGNLSLHIPDNALPEGVSIKDIVIEYADDISYSGAGFDYTYDLKPDGLKFLEPIEFEFNYTNSGSYTMPIVFHESDDDIEVIKNISLNIDNTNNEVNITGEISHFSRLLIHRALFDIDILSGGEYPVGGSVPFQFIVKPTGKAIEIRHGENYEIRRGLNYKVKPGTTYDMLDMEIGTGEKAAFGEKSKVSYDSPLTPSGDRLVNGKKGIKHDESFVFTETFFCESAGEDSVYATPSLQFTLQGDYYPWKAKEPVPIEVDVEARYYVKTEYKCSEDLMVRVKPYTIICPNGNGQAVGTYLTDATTGETIKDYLGRELDSITGKPIELDCGK